jgi:hypothetical protein
VRGRVFGRKSKFKPDGVYDSHPYQAVDNGKIDVDLGGRIVRFNSVEELIADLDHRKVEYAAGPSTFAVVPPVAEAAIPRDPPTLPNPSPKPKSGNGCGFFFVILIGFFAFIYFAGGNSAGSKVADIINSEFGRVCEAKIEGAFSNTLRLDWTAQTTKLHVVTVMAAIGNARETLYSKGIRYLKFPNDAGGYNVIDWKTGEKSSVDERARYHF